MRIVIPDDFPPVFAPSPHLRRLETLGEVICYTTRAASPAELLDRLAGAAAVINVRAFTRFDAELLARLPDLRLISISGTGTDNVDLAAATARGVVVCNTPDANSDSVAEYTWALLLRLCRRVAEMEQRLRAGEWWHHYGVELAGKTLGVVGLGRIGQRVARIGRGFGMRVIAWSLTSDEARARQLGVESLPLDRLLAEADVLSLHLRASERTVGLIGREALARMKPTALLVNTARGALVDEVALAEALAAGRIAGAALDVYTTEPLPAEHPLRQVPNCILSPHAGWMTDEARERMIAQPIDHVLAFFRGEPRGVVNPDALARNRS